MKAYNRVMAGRASAHAALCLQEGFIGVDFDIPFDLAGQLPDDWRAFNQRFIPVFLESNPGSSKIAAGLSCGATWTVAKGLNIGDVVITPDGAGRYAVGEITSDYFFVPGAILPHRRSVRWRQTTIQRSDMSEELRRSAGSMGTCCDITRYASELEALIGGQRPPELIATNPDVENVASFALERHLEDFLVSNWSQTELGRRYDIYSVDGEIVGQQFATDTGPIDVLAISKDGAELLVVELKKGRASDVVVGQIQRYMGYVIDELAEEHQRVKGVIIALEDDLRIRRALRVASDIEFMRYRVTFSLEQMG
jgi:restriction system protein